MANPEDLEVLDRFDAVKHELDSTKKDMREKERELGKIDRHIQRKTLKLQLYTNVPNVASIVFEMFDMVKGSDPRTVTTMIRQLMANPFDALYWSNKVLEDDLRLGVNRSLRLFFNFHELSERPGAEQFLSKIEAFNVAHNLNFERFADFLKRFEIYPARTEDEEQMEKEFRTILTEAGQYLDDVRYLRIGLHELYEFFNNNDNLQKIYDAVVKSRMKVSEHQGELEELQASRAALVPEVESLVARYEEIKAEHDRLKEQVRAIERRQRALERQQRIREEREQSRRGTKRRLPIDNLSYRTASPVASQRTRSSSGLASFVGASVDRLYNFN